MSAENDEFDDPKLADLLRRWGKSARRDPDLFEAPANLSAFHKALDEVDAELQSRAPGLVERLKSATEAAAKSAGDWIADRVGQARQTVAPIFRGARIALAYEGALRGVAETKFKSGDRIVVHMSLERSASLFVAMLTSDHELVPISSQARKLEAGPARLGPYRLDQNAGIESFVMIASETPRTDDEFRAIVETAAKSAKSAVATHEARLESALSALRGHTTLEVQALTFVHELE